MLKSINGWYFQAGTTLAAASKAAKTAGFQAIEPTLGEEGEITSDATEAQCRALAGQIQDAGLEVASLACGMFWTYSYTSREAPVRAKAHDLTIACLDRARWLGAGAILVLPGMLSHWETGGYLVSYPDALRYAHEALVKLACEAEARGVVIAIENVWNNFLVSPVEMREFIDRVNSPWVQAYLDVGNVVRYGISEDWVSTLGRRIARIHLKDYSQKIGGLQGFVPLGDGEVNWPAVMAALRAVGYDGPLSYEGGGDLADISRRIDRILQS